MGCNSVKSNGKARAHNFKVIVKQGSKRILVRSLLLFLSLLGHLGAGFLRHSTHAKRAAVGTSFPGLDTHDGAMESEVE